ncbi:monovalent cation/H+ antiporter subunit E [Halobaculum magnesiiphilum]|uniref:monovalent cation/H+ antiporter subunit E n=1 Tax=Halobaculum magnesiiphilum TaxID=1017351 RepID=UPI001CED6BF4|nr:monovalent cation/H+ antiporter subunit E [Halobaculum magnesiiphilum]
MTDGDAEPAEEAAPSGDIVVPVEESSTLRNTVGFVVRQAVESGEPSTLHFVFPLSSRGAVGDEYDRANDLLERIELWVEEDRGDNGDLVSVETAVVGADEYLFSPGDYADAIAEYAEDRGVRRVVLDPEYRPTGATPLLPALEWEIKGTGLDVEEATVERETRRGRLVRRSGVGQFLLLFGLSAGFYLFLAGWSLTPYNLLTGAASAGAVAATLWHVSFTGAVDLRRLTVQFGRLCLYAVFLLWEIAKANIQIAYVVLHPSLPIDPKMVEFDADVWSTVPAATLANSITLTPGTLTVDVQRRHFTIHSLTPGAREDLLDGKLERAVRFVFYGRSAARRPSPSEREEVEE